MLGAVDSWAAWCAARSVHPCSAYPAPVLGSPAAAYEASFSCGGWEVRVAEDKDRRSVFETDRRTYFSWLWWLIRADVDHYELCHEDVQAYKTCLREAYRQLLPPSSRWQLRKQA